jgi:tRNA G18 (ribose-2'-O)-methylase SpoU
VILILDNIRSVHNVGSIFRTADATGIEKIYLTGYTPTPLDRFGKIRKDFAKVSLGAERAVPWEQFDTSESAVVAAHAQGYTVAALEQHRDSKELFAYAPPQKVALVVGNEVEGVSAATLETCDVVIEIPMRGTKESLNVSVAAGIAMFTLLYTD